MPTEEHVKGIQLLKPIIETIPNVQDILVEKKLDGTSLKPDFQFDIADKKFVIEYQCTPISADFVRRREIYKNLGVQDMWLCGTEKFKHPCSYGQWGWYYDIGTESLPYKYPHLEKQASSIVEQQCDGYFTCELNYSQSDTDKGQLYLRGRTIFRMLKNRCIYPREIYTRYRSGSNTLKIGKYGLYYDEAYKHIQNEDQKWQSRDPYKSVKQHMFPLALYLEDYGINNFVLRSAKIRPNKNQMGELLVTCLANERDYKVKVLEDSIVVYGNSLTANGKCVQKQIVSKPFDKQSPHGMIKTTISALKEVSI